MTQKPKVFLLHFAGGSRFSFQFLTPLLPDFDVETLELPGRGKRVSEDLLKDFNLAALDIYNQLTKKLGSSRFIIYGHSLGAYLALRVSNLLEKAGKFPAYLIVSGNAGPESEDDEKMYLLGQEEFISDLEKLGGVPPEIIRDKELFSFFEPILRADFELAESHEMANEPAVKTPIFAMMGSQEEKAGEISKWEKFTRSRFNYEILEGDHFFIHKHPGKIAGVIRNCYQGSSISLSKLSGGEQKKM
jgi:external thioesterase TEII